MRALSFLAVTLAAASPLSAQKSEGPADFVKIRWHYSR
jgi:hypothetical protein